jgi:uncharacterized protein YutE (UPF0331/DUF86 family)
MQMKFDAYLAKTKHNAEEEGAVLATLSSLLQSQSDLSAIEFRAAKASLQLLIENAIGKARQLLRHLKCPVTPVTAHDAFRIMRDVGMLDDDDYSALVRAVGFRNAMIHDYMNFDSQVLLRLVRTHEYQRVIDFLTRDASYPELVLRRVERYAPIS